MWFPAGVNKQIPGVRFMLAEGAEEIRSTITIHDSDYEFAKLIRTILHDKKAKTAIQIPKKITIMSQAI